MAELGGTFRLGGDGPEVNRLGFGAMRLTGRGIWGEPPDREAARGVVRRAVELGVNLIDTADSYGPAVSEEIIAEALHLPGRPDHRHQGRAHPVRPRPLGPRRAPRASPRGLRGQPAPPAAGRDRGLPAARGGPEGAAGGVRGHADRV